MPKNRHKNAPKRRSSKPANTRPAPAPNVRPDAPAPETPAQRPMGPVTFSIGLIAILVAIVSSGMLALHKFEILKLPGCGAGSGCDQAAASTFGNFPIPALHITWPLAFLGVAYFIAIGVAWIVNRKGVSTALRAILICGGIASLFYVTIMFAKPDYLCPYCLATHVANFVLIGVALIAGGFSLTSSTTLATAGTAFFVASCALFVADRVSDKLASEKGEAQFAQSMSELTKRTDTAKKNAARNDAPTNVVQQPDTPTDPDAWKTDYRLTWTGRHGFTGNYLWGPKNAPIRIVIFSDYQCEDCARVHEEVKKLLDERSDVSFSHKHFPFAGPCNPKIDPKNPKHPNACWASRAAETAGILYGPEAFKSFHDWLFSVHGSFTDQEIVAELKRRGWDVQKFLNVMQSQRTLDIVQKDCQEGIDLGLFYTPMMFVNGVQIRGFRTPNVLTRAVEALARQNPPPGNATQDWPSSKLDKYIGDYFSDAINTTYPRLGHDAFRAVEGSDDAEIEIQAFMSYRSSFARDLQKAIDDCLDKHPGKIRVVYRHYPVTKACNPKVLAAFDDGEITYTMSKALEAVGMLKGPDAYVKLHRWTLQHQDDWKLDDFIEQAEALGLNPVELRAKIESPLVEQAIKDDVTWLTQVRLGAKAAIFINNKNVYNWNADNLPIIQGVVDRILAISN